MINKYIELHMKFIDLLAEYHNNHLYFIQKPNAYTCRLVAKTTRKIKRLTREMKLNNIKVNHELLEEKRKKIAEKKLKGEKKNERFNRTDESST